MKNKFDVSLKFFLFSLLFFVLSKANINGIIYPFAFSMLFSLAWANQKVWILAPAYLIGSIANSPTFEGIISSLVTITALVIPYYIHVASKTPMKKWEVFIYCLLSQSAYIMFTTLGGGNLIFMFGSLIVGEVFLFLSMFIFEPLVTRGLAYKLTTIELLCGSIVVMAISDGLLMCDIYGFSVFKLFVSLLILVVSYVSNVTFTLMIASIISVGTLFPSNNPIFVAPLILWGLAVSVYRGQNKIYSSLGLICAEMLSTFYFNLYYSSHFLSYLPVIISAIIFVVLPKIYLKPISNIFASSSSRTAIKNVVNRNRDLLQRRLYNLSEVFFDMNNVFKKMIKKEMSKDEVEDMLYSEVKNSICKNCPEHSHCHRTFGDDTKKMFKELIMIALERGKITLLDFPSYLSSRCGKLNLLINEINTLTNQYKSYRELVGNVDTSKLLISDQLEGISGIMKTLAGEVGTNISFDAARENRIKDELSSNNIICTDAVVYEKDARTTMAALVVRGEDSNKLKLQEITSKVCGNKMTVYDVTPTEQAELVSVNLKTSPRFDCIFGLSTHAKGVNSISGDCHSIERLDGDKFMFAICDGMGSGEKAGEKSETAINLIENFYKAGFDNEIVLSSVNKLLSLEKDDIFSTLDICTIDLKSGIADFVKMGAASTFVRGRDGCQIIESEALPIGIVDSAHPLTKKIVLNENDFIVLSSDGICDSFASDREMKDFLLTIKSANPQEFADKIIEKALSNNNGYAVDDMTCLVVKIF